MSNEDINDLEVKAPEMTQEERDQAEYMKELEAAKITDKALVENLKYMMGVGYLNFRVNYNLLTRNKNDLVVAINKLCNNLVTDSMF